MLRKDHIRPGVYMVKNIVTNDFYIGSTKNIYYRVKNHEWTLKNNRHGNSKMQKAALEHGYDSFNYLVLEFCPNSSREIREKYFIDLLKPTYNKWNSVKIPKGYKHSQESVDKMIKNNRGIRNKESFRNKLRESWKIRRQKPSGIETLKMLNRTGIKHSDETKLKIREALIKNWSTQEYREKILKSRAKKNEVF